MKLWPHICVGVQGQRRSECAGLGVRKRYRKVCHVRSRVEPSSLSAITFTRPTHSRLCTRVRKASGGSQGRARTCQVKKGMSPSCKHFLPGREHFLNPGTTTSVASSPANSRQWLSLSAPPSYADSSFLTAELS